VTLLTGFTRDQGFLELLAQRIKKAHGRGGTVRTGSIEVQGDLKSQVRLLLQEMGFQVRG